MTSLLLTYICAHALRYLNNSVINKDVKYVRNVCILKVFENHLVIISVLFVETDDKIKRIHLSPTN